MPEHDNDHVHWYNFWIWRKPKSQLSEFSAFTFDLVDSVLGEVDSKFRLVRIGFTWSIVYDMAYRCKFKY